MIDPSCCRVYLVGAGPGDPGLITVRGVQCLQQAQVVLYDYLVNPAVLEHAPATAELIALGHRVSGRGRSPDEIVTKVLAEVRAGRVVVRLKGGDPSVFARGADEAAALRKAGVPFEIVPGVTAGLAVAAYCEIPITQHDDASAVALITGRERDAKEVSHLDYRALALFPGTLVFYMGMTRAAEWSEALVQHGKPADTPVLVVRWCSRAEQQRVRCTLGTVAAVIAERRLRPPGIIVVGSVVNRTPEVPWFERRPLFGVRVLVPGSPATSQSLRDRLAQLGADPIIQPAIHITDPPSWVPVDRALVQLDQYDWLVFGSALGVDVLLRRLLEAGDDVRRLGAVRIAAIGAGTADRLTRYHIRADLVPEEFSAASLARELVDAGGRRILLVRSSHGQEGLVEALVEGGALVEQIVAYGSVDVPDPDPDVATALAAGEIDWIAITSSGAARALVHLYGEALRRARFATIGPLASAALQELGHAPTIEASPQTTAGLVEAILRTHSLPCAGRTLAALPGVAAADQRQGEPAVAGNSDG